MTENFPAMPKCLDYMWNISNGPILRPPAEWGGPGIAFSDWIQPVGDNRKPRPTIADDCAANKAKYATSPAAMVGFQYLEDVFKAGYLNKDLGVAKFDDGVRMVAPGEAAQNPMLTFALGNIQQNFPDNVADAGFSAQPGPEAAKNGLTVWMPSALYLPASPENQEVAKDFLAFAASVESRNIMIEANGATRPFLIKDCALPADVPASVADMLPYFQTEGITAPALEQITVEVGRGIWPTAEAAALYDRDVEKQAKQLGLPNW